MVAHRKGRQHQGGIAARPGATALCASTGSAQVDDAESAPLPPARPVSADSPLTGALGSPFPFVYREKRLVHAQLAQAVAPLRKKTPEPSFEINKALAA